MASNFITLVYSFSTLIQQYYSFATVFATLNTSGEEDLFTVSCTIYSVVVVRSLGTKRFHIISYILAPDGGTAPPSAGSKPVDALFVLSGIFFSITIFSHCFIVAVENPACAESINTPLTYSVD